MPLYVDVALPVPLDQPFTYAVPEGLMPLVGARVEAPWGRRRLVGVITALRQELPNGVAADRVKPFHELLDASPLLDAAMLDLVAWTASYYQAPIGEVMRCALPPAYRAAPRRMRKYRLAAQADISKATPAQRRALDFLAKAGEVDASTLRRVVSMAVLKNLERYGWIDVGEKEVPPSPPSWSPRPRVAGLNSEQQAALSAVLGADETRPILLHGVTGSGKTAVYLSAMEEVLRRGKSALLLVPEIGLMPTVFADFEDAFPGQVAVLHSGLTSAERNLHWRRLHDGVARVAIGTRSAVFAPLAHLGLILVDEEHDASFKQQESPRYHARDLAVLRGKLSKATVVLGSATPSLESFAHCHAGKYRLVRMSERVERRPLPRVTVIDMRTELERRPGGEAIFSLPLIAALRERIDRRQQSMLLINRRGYAPVVLCRACGASITCRDCSLSLAFHRRAARLICHFCGFSVVTPQICPGCGSEHLYFVGTGSEKVEEELLRLLPDARVARLDRDTTQSRHRFEQVLGRFRAGELDILVGTQMIAKGHDLPGVTLVGVLHADSGLNFPDFRAAERTYQLLTQVAGRAGRGSIPGEVLLQVVHPDHYAVAAATTDDFQSFFDKESNFRRWMLYPPFVAMAGVQLRDRSQERVREMADMVDEFLRRQRVSFPAIRILGPAPALIARAKTEFRMQFLFKSTSRRELNALLRLLRDLGRARRLAATAMIIDVDPLGF